MADRLESMNLLLAVVEHGSLSAVAKKHRIPLATLSRKISTLERSIGANLLHRGQRRVTLTEAGMAYVDAIRPLLEQLEQIEEAAAGDFLMPQGELSVTAPSVFGRIHVVEPFMEFLSKREALQGRLFLTNRHVRLREEGIDLAVRMGKVDDPSLIAVKVGTVRRVVCASPAYLERAGTPRRPEDLAKHHAVFFDGDPAAIRWEFSRKKAPVVVQPRHRVTVNDVDAALAGAVAGFGFARVFTYHTEQLLAEGKLVEVLREFSPEAVPVRLVYADRKPLPRRIREFVDWMAPRLRERLSE